MNNKKKLVIFILFFVIALLFWRLRVLFFYSDGNLPFLREVTGLTIHHYHYGIFLILVSALLLIFYKRNLFSIGLMGFGIGSVFDSVISGLIKTNTIRGVEITRYNQSLHLTIFLFFIVIMLSIVFYLISEKYKKNG
jgi:hypothetical protein